MFQEILEQLEKRNIAAPGQAESLQAGCVTEANAPCQGALPSWGNWKSAPSSVGTFLPLHFFSRLMKQREGISLLTDQEDIQSCLTHTLL